MLLAACLGSGATGTRLNLLPALSRAVDQHQQQAQQQQQPSGGAQQAAAAAFAAVAALDVQAAKQLGMLFGTCFPSDDAASALLHLELCAPVIPGAHALLVLAPVAEEQTMPLTHVGIFTVAHFELSAEGLELMSAALSLQFVRSLSVSAGASGNDLAM